MSASRSRTSVGSATLTIVLSITMTSRLTQSTDECEPAPALGRRARQSVDRAHDALRSAARASTSGSAVVASGDDERAAGAEHRVLALDVDADARW